MIPNFLQTRKPLLFGVALNISNIFSIEVQLIRILFILLLFPVGISLVIYLIGVIYYRRTKLDSLYSPLTSLFTKYNHYFRKFTYPQNYNNSIALHKNPIFRIIIIGVGIYFILLFLKLFSFSQLHPLFNFLPLLIGISYFFKKRIDVMTIIFFLALYIFLILLFQNS